MEEPSVLDFVKAKLAIWRKDGPQITLEAPIPEPVETAPVQEKMPKRAVSAVQVGRLPWKTIASFLFAFIAQFILEPPVTSFSPAVAFYGFAAVLLAAAFFTGEFTLAPLRENSARAMPVTIRKQPFFYAVPVLLIAFLGFSGNRFTLINVAVLLLGLGFVLSAVWLPARADNSFKERFWKAIHQPFYQICLSRWTLLVLFVIALVVFFRFYQLEQVPGEAFSDHAEKLLDVMDVLQGQTRIFFPRNTGREAFQMYLTALVVRLFGTGISYLSLKIGTALAGLFTLPFIYLLGKEVGNRWVGLLALLLAGIAYWPNVISRVGLRFPLYPLFAAPALYYLLRGIRTSNRNDFILSGIALGFGLHGYSPFRIVPLVLVIAVIIYVLHAQSKGKRLEVTSALVLLAFISLVIFLPLLRYALDDPGMFGYRALSRLAETERELPASPLSIFADNVFKASVMFFWNNGNVWVHSVPMRPALDVVTAVFFFMGCMGLFFRYIRERNWLDLFLLLSIPLLMLPSTLSLAFPEENPCLNRTGGAIIPVFVIAAIGMQAFFVSLWKKARSYFWKGFVVLFTLVLVLFSINQNYDLVFNQFKEQFLSSAWNSSEMGETIRWFADTVGSPETAYVVANPHWVDTRLVAINAGYPEKDYGLWPENLEITLTETRTKMFIVRPTDQEGINKLIELYPEGQFALSESEREGKEYLIYLVPAEDGYIPSFPDQQN